MKAYSRIPAVLAGLLLLLPGTGFLRPLQAQDNIIKRAYHDVTARDNAYFNANLKIQATEKKLFSEQKDNYEELLPIFKYGLEDAGKGVAPDMDDVIKRASFPIQLHENSKWVDDAYLLVGKAYFYKREYDKALESFQYLISAYEDIDKPRKKKKSSGKKKKKKKKSSAADEDLSSRDKPLPWLKHHKRSPESALWVVRTLVEMGRYSDAQTTISILRGDKKFPKALQGELETIQSHLLLRQGKYEAALEPLGLAIELTKPRLMRARYTFIQGQLYSRTGRVQEAIASFEKVLDLNPDFEMAFFTQITMANLLRDNKLKSGDEIKRMLSALLKDPKNREYYGLIHYAIADIELEQGKQEAGMESLNRSVREAGADKKQLGISYLRLADIYYDENDFQPAYYYYDSCLTALEQRHERYREAKDRRDGLEGLVGNLKTIETEKRLQHWAGLPEKARIAEIEEWIIATHGERDDEEEEDQFIDPATVSRGGGGTSAAASGKWYFYDEGRKGRGFSEFRKVWGKRPLEDDWRRSDKRSSASLNEQSKGTDGGKEAGPLDLDNANVTVDDIIAGLPLDSADRAESHQRVMESYYAVANIYKEYLRNDKQAIDYFRKLLDEYPQNTYRLQTAYNLYRLLGLPPGEPYKRIVLDEFPESVFAQVIIDPEYFAKLERKDDAVKEYYAATYTLFEKEQFAQVRARIADAEKQFAENPIKPQFALLDAMAIGFTDSVDVFKLALQGVVNDYPGTEQAARAQELLNHLRLGSVIQRAEEAKLEAGDYELDPASEHFVAVVVYETGREAAALKTRVSDFNREYYSLAGLRVSSLLFESDKTIVLVKTFANLDEAMRYFQNLRGDANVFADMESEQYRLIAVSRTNYTNLYRKKDLDGYVAFFERFYLTDN